MYKIFIHTRQNYKLLHNYRSGMNKLYQSAKLSSILENTTRTNITDSYNGKTKKIKSVYHH